MPTSSPRSPRADIGGPPSGEAADLPPAEWTFLGRVPFAKAAALQEHRRAAVIAGAAREALLLCEHDPVITLGRSADRRNVLLSPEELARRGVSVVSASRGGDVTYHGPGQLVGYPIFRVPRGVVVHVERMAAAIIHALALYGVRGEWRREAPGVWIGDEKICAFGVHVRHRVAVHGFALNVTTPLAAFDAIVPCGLRDKGITSLERQVGRTIPLEEIAVPVVEGFAVAFGRELVEIAAHRFDCQTISQI